LLKAGLSKAGYERATTIISLETILRELEKGRVAVRDPGWYFVTLFGEPTAAGKWGWRIDGHHLSLNFTLDQGRIIAATPAFFGANPATVKAGERAGLRPLADVEELAWKLIQSLDDTQRRLARHDKLFPDVRAGVKAAPVPERPLGLAHAAMQRPQRVLMEQLLGAYLGNLAPEVAEAERVRLTKAGLGQVHFAYGGSPAPGDPLTYRLHGPTFFAEFLNVQNDSAGNRANHIHTCWRCLPADFGLDKP
jgi:hypothetical protein